MPKLRVKNANVTEMTPNTTFPIVLEEFYKLKYCSTVVYMVPRA